MPRLVPMPWLALVLSLTIAPSGPVGRGVALANIVHRRNGLPHLGLKCAPGKKGKQRKTLLNSRASGASMQSGAAGGSGWQPAGMFTCGRSRQHILPAARDPLVMLMRGEQRGLVLRQAACEAEPVGRTMHISDILEWDWKRKGRSKRRSTRCLVLGCPLRASFGPRGGGSIPLRCVEHRVEGFDACLIGTPICQFSGGCPTYAAFGSPGRVGQPLFCAAHKQIEHINLACRMCLA